MDETRPARGGLRSVRPGARVDRLEIFFDLVFVFAFYNIARVTSPARVSSPGC